MQNERLKKKVLEFIKTQNLAVISTCSSSGYPQAAVVGISEMDDLSLFFGTFSSYRKYKNLKVNPRVALVIGWEDVTVQYEGVARELSDAERENAKQMHVEKLPSSKKFSELVDQCYFKIEPTWVRFTDYSKNGLYGEVFEIDFKNQ